MYSLPPLGVEGVGGKFRIQDVNPRPLKWPQNSQSKSFVVKVVEKVQFHPKNIEIQQINNNFLIYGLIYVFKFDFGIYRIYNSNVLNKPVRHPSP